MQTHRFLTWDKDLSFKKKFYMQNNASVANLVHYVVELGEF